MYIRLKRLADCIISLLTIIILTPVWLVLALWIKMDSPGPIFFKQKRVGIHKTHFNILKFRTMRTDTPKDMPTHLLANPEQYITRSGRFLRKTSLDELPQLFNILKGDMAIIGPRPALWNQFDLVEERDKYGANDVLPGLTGWAQINGRDELEIPIKAKLDGEYVERMSFGFDIKCFLGTITSVLRSDGVVEGGTGELSKKQKKVLIITNHSYMFWQFRRELTEELLKEYEVVLSTPFVGHEDDLATLGCRMIKTDIDRRGINLIADAKLLREYKKLIKQEKPDLVITYSIKPNIYAGRICRYKHIPHCVNVQGLGTAFQTKGIATVVTCLYRGALKKANEVFFENEDNAKVFRDRRITPKEQQIILPGAGVNLEYYNYQPMQEKEKVHFLYLGRIMKEKGMDELLDSVHKLNALYPGQFQLDLVGFFEDEYKEQVERLTEENVAVFHGFAQDPRPYYGAADCVVLPSYHEGMSNVLLEAAATGRALITSDIPGCREAVEANVSGLLCKKQSADSLLEQMQRFMELSHEERVAMGLAGRTHVETNFSKTLVVDRTMEVINQVIKDRR